MIILGIDPGTANTGYGVIKKLNKKGGKGRKNNIRKGLKCLGYGLIQTHPSLEPSERLRKLNNELSKIIKEYKPKVLALESLFFFKNLKTAIPVSQAGGVILLTAAKNKIPVYSFAPLQIKLAITGFGWAKKDQVQKKIKKILNLKEIPKPDDAADALATALAYLIKES